MDDDDEGKAVQVELKDVNDWAVEPHYEKRYKGTCRQGRLEGGKGKAGERERGGSRTWGGKWRASVSIGVRRLYIKSQEKPLRWKNPAISGAS